jgi:membrane-associated protease RseP (regulator of RpoE activity)
MEKISFEEQINQYDGLDAAVRRYFNIESVTRGSGGPKDYIVRYSGHLYSDDSSAVYDQLSEQLKPMRVTPLFRKDEDRQAILLIPELPRVRPSRVSINIILYILTVLSVFFVGLISATGGDLAPAALIANVGLGLAYTVSLLAILTAHEFGHYLVGRYHKAAVSPPYFIPFPLPPFGTMGAVINMKQPPKNRRTLLDIGVAGPLAGLIVAIPVLLIGLSLSTVAPLSVPTDPNLGLQMEGNSILYLLAKLAVFHRLLPAPASYAGVSPLLYWIRYFFTAQPFPNGGVDVTLHPVAWAGWAGILVTALNLIPAGQLDGGHMLYVLFGAQGSRRVLPFVLGALVLLGFVWNGWWLWAALVFFLVGRSYAEPLDQITPLDPKRKLLAALALVIFFLVFTPVPLQQILAPR